MKTISSISLLGLTRLFWTDFSPAADTAHKPVEAVFEIFPAPFPDVPDGWTPIIVLSAVGVVMLATLILWTAALRRWGILKSDVSYARPEETPKPTARRVESGNSARIA